MPVRLHLPFSHHLVCLTPPPPPYHLNWPTLPYIAWIIVLAPRLACTTQNTPLLPPCYLDCSPSPGQPAYLAPPITTQMIPPAASAGGRSEQCSRAEGCDSSNMWQYRPIQVARGSVMWGGGSVVGHGGGILQVAWANLGGEGVWGLSRQNGMAN